MLILPDPALDIALISFCVSIFTMVVRKLTTNQNKQDLMKEKQKAWSEKYKLAVKNKDEKEMERLNEEYKEVMASFKEAMNENFKPLPMLITLVPIMFLFWLLKDSYAQTPNVIVPFLGWELGWILWYLITAIISSILLENIYQAVRKQLKKRVN